MLGELIVLSKIIFATVALIGGIVLITFIKNIFNSIILPILEPFIPFIKTVIESILDFVESGTAMSIDFILDCIIYVKNKVLGVIANFNQISETEVEMEQEVFTLDENETIKKTVITSVIDMDQLPEEIKNNLDKSHNIVDGLLEEALLRLRGVNNVNV
jgi:hypothetical protein